MYNKKVLRDALNKLDSAKPRTQQKDRVINDKLLPFISSEGYKQGPPPEGMHYRIPGNVIHNPTPYDIHAIGSNGEQKFIAAGDTTDHEFDDDVNYVDEFAKMQKGGFQGWGTPGWEYTFDPRYDLKYRNFIDIPKKPKAPPVSLAFVPPTITDLEFEPPIEPEVQWTNPNPWNDIEPPKTYPKAYLPNYRTGVWSATGRVNPNLEANRLNTLNLEGQTFAYGGDISIPQLNQYEDGGDYIDIEATDAEIDQLRKGGYIVKEHPSLPKKKGSKAYSKSLMATNQLFAQNPLTKKAKSKKNKIFDPNAKYYQVGGERDTIWNQNLAKDDKEFQDWYWNNSQALEASSGIPYSEDFAYDYYSYFKNKDHLDTQGNPTDHYIDKYKRPQHPVFSDQSLYSTPENPGGHWETINGEEVLIPHQGLSLTKRNKKLGGFQDDIDKHRDLLRDWTYGASIGMLHKAQTGLTTVPTQEEAMLQQASTKGIPYADKAITLPEVTVSPRQYVPQATQQGNLLDQAFQNEMLKKADWERRSSGAAQPVDWVWTLPLAATRAPYMAGEALSGLMATEIPGLAGTNIGQAINAGFIGKGLYDAPSTVGAWQDVAAGKKDWKDAAEKTAWNLLDFTGAGETKEGLKLLAEDSRALNNYLTTQTPLRNAYKVNPFAFKPQEGMMYRGLGQEGYADAIQSGVFRPKQYTYPEEMSFAEIANAPKQFDNTFYAPAEKFGIVQNYGPEYLAEVPFEGNQFGRRYKGKNWSWSTPREIPIDEGRILQKDWLRGYKEVPVELPGSPNTFTKSGLGGMDMSRYEIKNPDYFTQLLNTYDNKSLSPSNKKFYKDLIASVKKQNGLVTERQYNELQRLKTGNFNYGPRDYSAPLKAGFDENLITRPLTPFGKTELTPGNQWYRKIGNEKGLQDLINKQSATAPAPMRMKSGVMLDAPFFGRGQSPAESYKGLYAVELKPEAASKYQWASRVAGVDNYGSVPLQNDRILKGVPLEDLNVYKKKWFSNNYRQLDPNNLQEGLKNAALQRNLENMYKWGVRGYLGKSAYDHFNKPDSDQEDGGYIETQLTQKEIDEYRKGGYIVDELD